MRNRLGRGEGISAEVIFREFPVGGIKNDNSVLFHWLEAEIRKVVFRIKNGAAWSLPSLRPHNLKVENAVGVRAVKANSDVLISAKLGAANATLSGFKERRMVLALELGRGKRTREVLGGFHDSDLG